MHEIELMIQARDNYLSIIDKCAYLIQYKARTAQEVRMLMNLRDKARTGLYLFSTLIFDEAIQGGDYDPPCMISDQDISICKSKT